MSDLPPGWEWATLDELVCTDGCFTDGDWVETKDQDPHGDVRLIQLADIGEGQFRDRSNRYLTSEAAKRLRCSFLQPGDVLIARMPEPLGRACLYPGGTSKAVTVVDVCIFRPGEQGVDPRWLMWWINSPAMRQRILDLQTGTTRKRISRRNLSTIELPVPPLTEQRRIVATLDANFSHLDAGTGLLAEAKQRLSRMIATLGTELLAPEVDSSKWEEIPIGEIATSIRNGCFVSRPGSTPNGVPILRIGAIRPLRLDLSDLRYSGRTSGDLRRSDHLLEAGDILFTRYSGNPSYVGACAVVPSLDWDLTYPDKLIRVKVDTTVADSEFVALTCSSGKARAQIDSLVKTTAGQAGISGRDLKAVCVRLPNLNDQRRIVTEYKEKASDVTRLDDNLVQLINQSTKLRRSLLADAFTGQLVPQDSNDEPALTLLERIQEKRETRNPGRAQHTPNKPNEQESLL